MGPVRAQVEPGFSLGVARSPALAACGLYRLRNDGKPDLGQFPMRPEFKRA
jgi:hypothetical protein